MAAPLDATASGVMPSALYTSCSGCVRKVGQRANEEDEERGIQSMVHTRGG